MELVEVLEELRGELNSLADAMHEERSKPGTSHSTWEYYRGAMDAFGDAIGLVQPYIDKEVVEWDVTVRMPMSTSACLDDFRRQTIGYELVEVNRTKKQ